MPKKSTEEMIEELALSVARGFDELHQEVRSGFFDVNRKLDETKHQLHEVVERLDRVEFLVSGQDRRINTLEDRMRQVATKLGLTFN